MGDDDDMEFMFSLPDGLLDDDGLIGEVWFLHVFFVGVRFVLPCFVWYDLTLLASSKP
jgi:hypothetical protein